MKLYQNIDNNSFIDLNGHETLTLTFAYIKKSNLIYWK